MSVYPRLPLSGIIDLTYRCNNVCQHCWLWLAENAPEARQELSFAEISRVVLEARALGCRDWAISGGEPMLRADFAEIFDFITRHARVYSLNTNGTLITPAIAQLMKRKGDKMVALYGATAEVHDAVTRAPGSFEAAMRGFAYLREAGAGFTVQVVPMRANFHQYRQMLALAESLSPLYRIGAAWLNLSACGSRARNQAIAQQRLQPAEVMIIEPPVAASSDDARGHRYAEPPPDAGLLWHCIFNRDEFHIDPYGGMSFCSYIKDPALRYDLRAGSFAEGWETFLPSLGSVAPADDCYRENCGACALRADCRWCAAHARIETGSYTAPIPYLCQIAQESRNYQQDWMQNHTRYYQIGGISVQVESDLPIEPGTFDHKFTAFAADGPVETNVVLRHHFSIPPVDRKQLGKQVYKKSPWEIYENPSGAVYLMPTQIGRQMQMVANFNRDYTVGDIYHASSDSFKRGGMGSLTFFPTDQIVLAQVLADHQACYFHSSGVILNDQGYLFVGHSGAGKSTTLKLIRHRAQILCDDRNIVRRWPEGFRLHGSWSHGEIPQVSAGEAPLRAILFLEKARVNRATRLEDPAEIVRRLPFFVIKPLVSAQWWHKVLTLVEDIAREVPCYRLEFDKSGAVLDVIEQL